MSRETVLDAMVVMLQQFLRELTDRNLLSDSSPVVELENAGWGLEFGAQTAERLRVTDATHRRRI